MSSQIIPVIKLLAIVVACVFVFGLAFALVMHLARPHPGSGRMETVNHLKQLGIALHNYHDLKNSFPTEGSDHHGNLYVDLLPFLDNYSEGRSIHDMCTKSGNFDANHPAARTHIKLYTCPSRRAETAGWKDFAYLASDPQVKSILDQPKGVTLTTIAVANGTSRTLLLSVYAMRPSLYSDKTNPAYLWKTPNNSRSTVGYFKDANSLPDDTRLGSPYFACPSVFADGHVANIPTTIDATTCRYHWNYSNTANFTGFE